MGRVNEELLQKYEDHMMKPEVRGWMALLNSFRKVYRPLAKGLYEEGSSVGQFQTLFSLYFLSPISSIEIAQRALVSRANISSHIKNLKEKDFLIFEPCPKKKNRILLSLNDKGKIFFENLYNGHLSRIVDTMPALSSNTICELERVNKSGALALELPEV